MKKIIIILISVISMNLNAQDEVLMPLGANINLYYQTQNFQNVAKNEIIPNNVVLLTDSLPFIDDFSSNTLQKLGEPQYDVTKTILFATGSCVINDDFDFEKKAFHNSPTYTYTYNLITTQVDSVESLDTIKIYTFSNSECFPIETSIANYWEPYYRSDVSDFNTVTGEKLDSTLVMPTDSINIATVQIARNNNNWNDNYAWWNTTNPIEPITIGVATLDGLNEFGLPYNNSVTNAYGIADYLTSKQIDLSGLGLNDDVYLSFFYQAGGMGDNPNPQDSLIVEIKGADGVWKRKWSSEGMASSDFKQAYVKIYETNFDSLIYSNNEFQFRFKNYASLSGNNDWWNIDYVRLDKNRLPGTIDTVIRDVSMLYDFPNYLTNFSKLPWKQMQAGADVFVDEINIQIRDNGQVEGLASGNFPLGIVIDNSANLDTIYKDLGSNFNANIIDGEIKDFPIAPFTNFTMPTITNSDSIYFNSEMYIGASNRNFLKGNDTIKNTLLFHNVLAYDDGSAEKAYGLSGGGSEQKQFAYEFNIATQDTLAAIQIHFSNIDENVENLVFSLYAWDSIKLSSDYANIIGSIDNKTPDYIDYKNGFATFVFNEPIIVNDKFYIGWSQIENKNLQIGYDLNSTKGKTHMYVFTSDTWNESSIGVEGSPMMRAILDGDYPIPSPNGISELQEADNISVFPNPTSTVLNIVSSYLMNDFEINIYDFSGRVLFKELNKDKVDVSKFSTGIYIVQVIDLETSKSFTSKFIVK